MSYQTHRQLLEDAGYPIHPVQQQTHSSATAQAQGAARQTVAHLRGKGYTVSSDAQDCLADSIRCDLLGIDGQVRNLRDATKRAVSLCLKLGIIDRN